jgi:hypothetical protein
MLLRFGANKQREISVPYHSDVGWGRFHDGSLWLDPAVTGQGLLSATTASPVSGWGSGYSEPTICWG